MQTEAQKALYWELELITDPIVNSEKSRLITWLNDLWWALARSLTIAHEPKVWESKDWFGNTVWNVYLPKTGQTVRFSSEAEVRIWLEEHLYLL